MHGITRTVLATVVLAAGAALTARPTQAQVSLGVGAGATLPIGNFKDAVKLGWNGTASLGFTPAAFPLGFRAEGSYVRNSFKDAAATAGHTQMWVGTGNLVYTFAAGAARVHPYLIAGAGVYNVKAKLADGTSAGDSQTKFGLNGGLGINVGGFGTGGFFVEGRFHDVFKGTVNDIGDDAALQFVNLNAGVRYSFGGGPS